MSKIKVFIGWDGREKAAYEVLKHSIEKYTKEDVDIIPLYHKELRKQGLFKRPWLIEAQTGNYVDLIDGKNFSTEFSHSRFLVPEIMKYNGWALFMDCDMIFKDDIKKLFSLVDDKYAVMCVKHKQKVDCDVKMDGSLQQDYRRKNWSSFMMINCGHPSNRALTKDVVNTATGNWLHNLSWLKDSEIGDLPDRYNWIAGTSRSGFMPSVIHYTLGGPWFKDYQDCPYADDWWDLYRSFNKDLPDPAADLNTVDYGEV